MSRGFVIVATGDAQYITCANTLTDSIHRTMPHALVSLITDHDISDSRYDHIIKTTSVSADPWRLADDYQVYNLSPYQETIKLESDLYLPRAVDWWWDAHKDRDLNICTTIRDYRGNISTSPAYRQTFIDSGLPSVYNAMTYFKKSNLAEGFYATVKDIFENWPEVKTTLKHSSEENATTDVVYGIAALLHGVENCTMPSLTDFSMVHMKRWIQNLQTEVWHNELVYEVLPHALRIQSHHQWYPVHYYNKDFATIINRELANEQ